MSKCLRKWQAAEYIRTHWPYFDRKGGADHIWVSSALDLLVDLCGRPVWGQRGGTPCAHRDGTSLTSLQLLPAALSAPDGP